MKASNESTKVWQQMGNDFYLGDTSSQVPQLRKGIYNFCINSKGMIYTSRREDQFTFPFKVYGLEREFIERMPVAFNKTGGNLGILLNGVKGTGKTVTARCIANKMDLPTIILSDRLPGIAEFIAEIPQDVVIMVDEFEKIFSSGKDEEDDGRGNAHDFDFLSVMDGVHSSRYRRVFILTTNELWVSRNMLGRPGRIRYLKEFRDIAKEQVIEIMDDLLDNKDWQEDIIAFLKPLEIVTVDIVKSVIQEVNIFNQSPDVCCGHMNLEFKSTTYDMWRVNVSGKKLELLDEEVPSNYVARFLGDNVNLKRYTVLISSDCRFGILSKVKNMPNTFMCTDQYGRIKGKFLVQIRKHEFIHSSLDF